LKADDDQIMWPDWTGRQIELSDKAGYFDFMQRPSVAEWMRLLAEKVATRNPRKMLMLYFNETIRAWTWDFAGNDLLRKATLNVVSGIIFSAFATGQLDEQIQTVLPILRELRDNFDNLTPLAIAFVPFKRKGDYKMRFYGMSYHYQLFVEGIFDESIRLLFLLASRAKGKTVSLVNINRMNLRKLKKGFRALGIPDVFFPGWNNRIRNSIAHSRFRYDDKYRMMHFVDIDPYGNLPDYSGWFTLDEFGQLGRQLSDVYGIIQDSVFMMRIRQLMLAPEVPKLAEDLLMPRILNGIKEGVLVNPYS
jgi:hypothetical protein